MPYNNVTCILIKHNILFVNYKVVNVYKLEVMLTINIFMFNFIGGNNIVLTK